MHRLQTTVLTIAAIALCVLCCPAPPAGATAMSPLVMEAGSKLCSGRGGDYIGGCKFYLHARINEQKNSTDALARCKYACGLYFPNKPYKCNNCEEGCDYLRGKDQ